VNLIQKVKSRSVGDLEGIATSLQSISSFLEQIGGFVDRVVVFSFNQNGEIESNGKVGRALMNAISSIPRVDPVVFKTMVTQHRNDLKTIAQLAELTRKQLDITEKLHALVA
jgi:translation initiation factor 3 subunit F